MPKLLIKLTPLEPYFLGGERIFEIGDGNKHYFIRSLDTPAQSTLFGVLRYLAIEKPGSSQDFKKRYQEFSKKRNLGEFKKEFRGYALNKPEVKFENIHGISPLYLVDNKTGCFYAPLPFDHRVDHRVKVSGCESENYTPFEKWSEPIRTTNGERCLPLDYKAKDGLANGWIALAGSRCVRTEDIFHSSPQVGIGQTNEIQAFFKKEYKYLEEGFSFAFFADIDMPLYNHIVYIGQGKSPFCAEWQKAEEPEFPKAVLREGFVYAQSDIYYTGDIRDLYGKCYFVCAKTHPHRIFQENYLDRTGSSMVQLIRAGSVFWPNDASDFATKLKNDHAEIAGFNKIVIGGNTQ